MEESRPEDCDESLWDQILALRERRQDQDDVLNELAKRSAELKKEADALAKKDKAAGKALASLREEMSLFQREKQETMNMIETTVTLRLRQVEYLYEGKLPLRLSDGVVFSRSNLEGLRARIDALVREKAALRATQRDLRREHAALRQDTAALTERNRALDDAATRMTMLRFGKRIDLEKMERALIPKKGIEELKVSLRETEAAHQDELRRWTRTRRGAARADARHRAKHRGAQRRLGPHAKKARAGATAQAHAERRLRGPGRGAAQRGGGARADGGHRRSASRRDKHPARGDWIPVRQGNARQARVLRGESSALDRPNQTGELYARRPRRRRTLMLF